MSGWSLGLLGILVGVILAWGVYYTLWWRRLRALGRQAEQGSPCLPARLTRFRLSPWLELGAPGAPLSARLFPGRRLAPRCALGLSADRVWLGPAPLDLDAQRPGLYWSRWQRPLARLAPRLAERYEFACRGEEQERSARELLAHPRVVDALLAIDPAVVYSLCLRAPGGRRGWLSVHGQVPADSVRPVHDLLEHAAELVAALEQAAGKTRYR